MKNASLVAEVEGADLGDARRSGRLMQILARVAEEPGLSLPETFGPGSNLEATYRFLNNADVDSEAILRPHIDATRERSLGKTVLVIHDTTEFRFGGKAKRLGLGLVGVSGQGFYGHFSFAVSSDGRREPLGVVGLKTWVRDSKKGIRSTSERRLEPTLESDRWLEQSKAVEKSLDGIALVHVEDREGDIYESLAQRVMQRMRFIVRGVGNRRVVLDGGREKPLLEQITAAPTRCTRAVLLSERNPTREDQRKRQPQRRARQAILSISGIRIELRRPTRDDTSPKSLMLNVVYVVEKNPPEGEIPVEWVLMTSEPIETEEQLAWIVDGYRARWIIEEFFKALKTGCGYEARQLESYDALRRALSIYSIVAWHLLVLRHLERHDDGASAATIAPRSQIAVLQAQGRLGSEPTVREYLKAVANLGGHIPRNGPPGWLILWRGIRALELLATGWDLSRCDQS